VQPTRIARAEQCLRRNFGFAGFRIPQRRVVSALLAGRDVLAVLPTGAGKSVCFQVPALLDSGLTIVVSPLISLMEDQVAGALRRGLPAAALTSAQPGSERLAVLQAMRSGRLKLLYVSPERLRSGTFLREITEVNVSRLVVDEAHCISEWGHDFRPSYLRIGAFRRLMRSPPTVALTATATAATRQEICANLELHDPVRVLAPVDRPNLRWDTRRTRTLQEAASRVLAAITATTGQVIVYQPTRRQTVRLAASLRRRGTGAAAYHAGLPATIRTEVQHAFLHRELRVICATNAFGMGIDHPDIRAVFHLGIPGSLEAYVQESGRAGRDGLAARCVLFSWSGDARLQRRFAATTWPSARLLHRVWRALPVAHPIDPIAFARAAFPRVPTGEVQSALRIIVECGAAREERHAAAHEGRAVRYRRGSERLRTRLEFDALGRGRRRALQRVAAVSRYVRARSCLRAVIARYFDEPVPECAGCGRCGGTVRP
jgi:ATP-dependent DNA helicase RecQ